VEGVGGWLGAWEGEPQRRKQHNLKVFPLFSVVFRLYFLVLVLKLHNSLDLFFFFSMSILVLRIGNVLDADPDPDPLIFDADPNPDPRQKPGQLNDWEIINGNVRNEARILNSVAEC